MIKSKELFVFDTRFPWFSGRFAESLTKDGILEEGLYVIHRKYNSKKKTYTYSLDYHGLNKRPSELIIDAIKGVEK